MEFDRVNLTKQALRARLYPAALAEATTLVGIAGRYSWALLAGSELPRKTQLVEKVVVGPVGVQKRPQNKAKHYENGVCSP
ncbi:MAG: hypothetical protein M3441_27050 [Chloroflexota bacterium]|nr:hypothetical protein [Chloroflexota bacterium]